MRAPIQFPARSCNMRILTLLFFLCLVLTVFQADSRPIQKHVEKRSLLGLGAFAVSFLNTILAINLNTSINRQIAEFGGIIGG